VASKAARPGRTLVIFFLVLAVIYALVALGQTWKPALGLDLQGGTRITLAAVDDNNDPATFDEAARIIDDRVNGSGVVEAEVTTQNNQFIVVEVPGESSDTLVDTVKRQAQMRFRLVAQSAPSTGTAAPTDQPTDQPTGQTSTPGSGIDAPTTPSAEPNGSGSAEPTQSTSPSGSNKNRAPFLQDKKKKKKKDKKDGASESPSGSPTGSPTETPTESPTGSTTGSPTGEPTDGPAETGDIVADAVAWTNNVPAEWQQKFAAFSCPAPGDQNQVVDDPDKPLITCDDTGTYKYLLTKAVIEGTELDGAAAEIPQNDVQYVVTLDFNGDGTKTFADVSRALYGTEKQFAIVLDGRVLSAPTMNGLILDGRAQISGNFTRSSAESLATSLKYGSLPIRFQADPLVETVGPSLAGNQLRAGITAGLAGLLLVMLYCLFYYRGLGTVVIASLLVAAAMTYGLVLLLSKSAGFTLSLPGIAGLIVAVGITADSFIVYFERIRDEMRDGKSMRVAVEAGWLRARNTCLAADAVSLLAAVVLYIFAAGVVKGFAFALGLSTLIDLAVFFWFTHPMVSLLARYPFFNRGHKLSGLSAGTLGIDRLPAGGAV